MSAAWTHNPADPLGLTATPANAYLTADQQRVLVAVVAAADNGGFAPLSQGEAEVVERLQVLNLVTTWTHFNAVAGKIVRFTPTDAGRQRASQCVG